MIGMTKKDELLAYFDRLIEAYKNDYHCAKEIAEVIDALRIEYGLYSGYSIRTSGGGSTMTSRSSDHTRTGTVTPNQCTSSAGGRANE